MQDEKEKEKDELSRHEDELPALAYLDEHGVLEGEELSDRVFVSYDSLDAMLMGLVSGHEETE
jgi:hypothetical protein